MRREHYSLPLECSKCGRTGRAEMSDDAKAVRFSDFDTRVEEVPEGFKIVKGSGVVCADCGIDAFKQ